MKKFLIAIGLLATPAMAADIYVPVAEAQPVQAHDWSGLYLGVYGGAGAIVNEITAGPLSLNGIGGEGVFGGAMAGYDFQMGNFVIGAQGEIGIGNLETSLAVPGFALDASPTWDYSISLRGGMLVHERALLYLIGGYTHAEYEVNIPGASFEQDYDGWHVGTGLDVAITDSMFAGIEYRYTQLSGESWTVGGLDVEPSSHTGRLRVGYKF